MQSNTGGVGRKLFETHYLCVGEILGYIARRHRLASEDREDFASFAMFSQRAYRWPRRRPSCSTWG